jgi:hypothetical protein
MMAGRVIAYKSKYQQTIALSSTEAEFTAAAEAGKTRERGTNIVVTTL